MPNARSEKPDASATPLPGDDRVLAPTRVVSVVIIPVLTAAFVILYLRPERTSELWAWEIQPTMTARVMGAGYLAGAYFFYRAATVRQWHRIRVGFVAVTVFASMLGATTILHWDRFNHDHLSFWVWVLLYVSTPLLLPWLWARNRRHDPATLQPGDRVIPGAVRAAMVVAGAAQLVVVGIMFLAPATIAPHAPWSLTPLATRSLSAFAVFPSIVYLAFAAEKRWSALQILVDVAVAGTALIVVAAVLAHEEFDGGAVTVWGWRIVVVVSLVLLIALRVAMARPVAEPQGNALVASADAIER